MFREIVKDVYIGKSQLGIWVNGKRVPKETLVKDIALPTLLGNKLPDYGTIGNFTQWEFEVNPGGNHKLFITGIPKKTYDLDLYRLKGDYGHPITRMIKGDTYFRYYLMMLNT